MKSKYQMSSMGDPNENIPLLEQVSLNFINKTISTIQSLIVQVQLDLEELHAHLTKCKPYVSEYRKET